MTTSSRSSPTYERKRISPISTYLALLLKCGSMTGSNAFASCSHSVRPSEFRHVIGLGSDYSHLGSYPNFVSVGRSLDERMRRVRINLWSVGQGTSDYLRACKSTNERLYSSLSLICEIHASISMPSSFIALWV